MIGTRGPPRCQFDEPIAAEKIEYDVRVTEVPDLANVSAGELAQQREELDGSRVAQLLFERYVPFNDVTQRVRAALRDQVLLGRSDEVQ
jgi:hypothetical protein